MKKVWIASNAGQMGALRVGLVAVGLGLGCGGESGGAAIGDTVAAISTVPAGVQCVRITLRGATQSFDVAPGSSSVLNLGPQAPGSLVATALAYNSACSGVGPSSVASWVSDPVSVTVAAGLTTQIPIVLRPNTPTSATVDFVAPVVEIASPAVGSYNFARRVDGSVVAWGSNYSGELGDGTTTNRRTPAPVVGFGPGQPLATVQQIALGNSHGCALLSDGSAHCWGTNVSGQLGDGTNTSQSTPASATTVSGGLHFVQLAAGVNHTCGVTMDPATGATSAWCWGLGMILGNNSSASSNVPVQVVGDDCCGFISPLSGVVELKIGYGTTCARMSDGTARCWGGNGNAQACQPASGSLILMATQVPGLGAVTDVAVGAYHSCFVLADGTVRCCGLGGELGDGTTGQSATPVTVSGLNGVTAIAAGYEHTIALRSDGTAWCWGGDFYGQCGDQSATGFRTSPVPVVGLSGAAGLTAGSSHSCARLTDGTVRCWGDNGAGEVGDGTLVRRFSPVRTLL